MIRIFRHYIPRSFIVLALAEFIILIFSVYGGVALRFMHAAHERSEVEPVFTKALLFAVTMLVAMIVVGLYQRKFREGMGGMLLRVTISALLGLALMSVIFYAFPNTFLGRGAFGLAFGIAVIGIILVRTVFFRLVDQETLARRVLVLGRVNAPWRSPDCGASPTGVAVLSSVMSTFPVNITN